MRKKVVVGMSGGVDSSAAAYLLKEQGYEVAGVTMGTGQNEEGAQTAAEDAAHVARVLGIAHDAVDFGREFKRHVVDYFVAEYLKGRTPNPCNVCNRFVKWEALLEYADRAGADYVATGHYARIRRLDCGRDTVCRSATAAKDQSYALYNLTQRQLSRTLLPAGEYEKTEIRRIAEAAKLPVADKQDSQDICFVPDGDYAAFIRRESGCAAEPGNFVDETGRVLGRHKGIIHYTVGQRRGLGISASEPLFVQKLRPETNEVVLCRSEGLFGRTCEVSDVNYMAESRLSGPTPAVGRIRYSHGGSQCTLYPQPDGTIRCVFEEAQRAMTPGQAAVFYREDGIVCGGTIRRAFGDGAEI